MPPCPYYLLRERTIGNLKWTIDPRDEIDEQKNMGQMIWRRFVTASQPNSIISISEHIIACLALAYSIILVLHMQRNLYIVQLTTYTIKIMAVASWNMGLHIAVEGK